MRDSRARRISPALVKCSQRPRVCVLSDDLESQLSLDTVPLGCRAWNGIGKLGRFGALAQIGQHIKAGRHRPRQSGLALNISVARSGDGCNPLSSFLR